MQQLALAKIAIEKEVDGVPMGVLEDGTAYLTNRGLARVCDVAHSAISRQAAEWESGDRSSAFAKLLMEVGVTRQKLYVDVMVRGVRVNAYPDDVCMIFLHYYANVAREPSKAARSNHLKLSTAGLRLYVYGALGYDPHNRIPPGWRDFHERLMVNSSPPGHFSVFSEMSKMVLIAIQHGLVVDSHTIPDGSVGGFWSKHWLSENLAAAHGGRIKHEHNYPDHFPQAQANGYIESWAYPNSALGVFRVWMDEVYLPQKFPAYLNKKVKERVLPQASVTLLLRALDVDLPDPDEGPGRLPGI